MVSPDNPFFDLVPRRPQGPSGMDIAIIWSVLIVAACFGMILWLGGPQ